MFEEGMQPVDVTIALQIGPEETLKYHGQYQRLIGLEEIPKVIDILGDESCTIRQSFQRNEVRI